MRVQKDRVVILTNFKSWIWCQTLEDEDERLARDTFKRMLEIEAAEDETSRLLTLIVWVCLFQ